MNRSDKCRGTAMIHFKDSQSAEQALAASRNRRLFRKKLYRRAWNDFFGSVVEVSETIQRLRPQFVDLRVNITVHHATQLLPG